MKAVIWHGGADLRYEDIDGPEPKAGEVLADVVLTGICGSDLHAIRGHHGPRRPPLILGHEVVATIAGSTSRYALLPLSSCDDCRACARGETNLCPDRLLLGLHRPGTFAERVAVREDALVEVPDGLDERLAVLVEPLATPLSALRIEALPAGGRIGVIGCGTIGLLAVHAAIAAGLEVVAVEPLPARSELARRLGAHRVERDVTTLAGTDLDAVLDTAGFDATVTGAIAAVRSGGSVTVIGLGGERAPLPLGELVRRGIRVRGHYAYTRADFEAALRLLVDQPLPLDWLTVMPLPAMPEGAEALIGQPDETIKVILEAPGGSSNAARGG